MMRPAWRNRDIGRSRELRREASPAERRLWAAISSGRLNGHRFTRQFQIGPFFADLVCRKQKLVVEIDGFSHDMRQTHDAKRDRYLANEGYRVLRFSNDDVAERLEGIVEIIALALASPPSPDPSRKREGSI